MTNNTQLTNRYTECPFCEKFIPTFRQWIDEKETFGFMAHTMVGSSELCAGMNLILSYDVTQYDRIEVSILERCAALPRDCDKGNLHAVTSIGCYQLAYYTTDNDVLCPYCANKSANDPDELPNRKPVNVDVLFWDGQDTFCDECSLPIDYDPDNVPERDWRDNYKKDDPKFSYEM